jgi:hypothetical protein
MKRLALSMLSIVPMGISFFACDGPQAPQRSMFAAAARGEIRPAEIPVESSAGTEMKRLPFFSSGVLSAASSVLSAAPSDAASRTTGPDLGIADDTLGCMDRNPDGNVRVNQDCTFRRQAETDIAFNPLDPENLVAAQNDSRVGFNQTGIDWSIDTGEHWGDLLPPFRGKLNNPAAQEPLPGVDPNRHTVLGGPGTLHTYDAASDPGLAFDSQGRVIYSAVAFDVNSAANMVFVTVSPPGAGGSFFLDIPAESRRFIVAEDNNPNVAHDKPFITADQSPSSPNRDNVYVTWTLFRFGCGVTGAGFCESPVFGAMSTDHGLTWSTPELVSGANPSLCVFGDFFTEDPSDASLCNFDQGSDPAVLPNGDLVVAFINNNTRGINGQQLAVTCHPTGSSPEGTAHLNCDRPTKIGDDIVTGQPLCDFGRGPEPCIPGTFVRTNDFPRIAVNTENGHLFVVWSDYRNGEYDVQLSRSTNGGERWSQSVTVNPDFGLDHYFPAVDVAERTSSTRVGVSYYRTERVPNESPPGLGSQLFAPCAPGGAPPEGMSSCEGVQTSRSDYVLAGGTGLQAPFNFTVVSPVFLPPDGIQTGFLGDYTGLVVNQGIEAHPIWADTRNADPFTPMNGVTRDEDVFVDSVELPRGRAELGPGTIGSE